MPAITRPRRRHGTAGGAGVDAVAQRPDGRGGARGVVVVQLGVRGVLDVSGGPLGLEVVERLQEEVALSLELTLLFGVDARAHGRVLMAEPAAPARGRRRSGAGAVRAASA